ncbi:MAG TPA: hypothetical protein PKW95_16740 [bacterium]|nr:hypothetical protein [bacterium]
MRRLACLAVVITLLAVAPAFAQTTLPLEATVPDAAAVRITEGGFAWLSEAITAALPSMGIPEMIMGYNPILELDCTNLLVAYLETDVNITAVNIDNSTVTLSTDQVGGLGLVSDALYALISLAPATGESLVRIEMDGMTGDDNTCSDEPLFAAIDLYVSSLDIAASVTVDYSAPDGFAIEIHEVKVAFNDLDIVFTGMPEELEEIVELLLTTTMTDLIEEMAPELINQLIEEQLGDVVLEGTSEVGDWIMEYAFTPAFDTDSYGLLATTDGKLFLQGTTLDACIDEGQTPGSRWTVNPLPAMGATTPGGDPYHFGVALSDDLLNQFLYSFFAKGELCLMFPWDLEDGRELSLAAFEGMTAPWRAAPEWEDEANMIDLYPLEDPHFVVGQGTTDLALVMQPYRLDWYIIKQQRYVSMLNVEIDLTLALSMDTDEENNLIITLEGSEFVFDVEGTEFNALPPELVETLINGIINFVLPLIVDVLPPIPLPAAMGYQFTIDEIGSVGTGNDYFGLFCSFVEAPTKGPAAAFALPTFGTVRTMKLDGANSARAGLAGIERPTLHLTADPTSAATAERFRVRVDGRGWQTAPDGLLDLTYWLEGRHTVEAVAISPEGIAGEPATLSFVLDRVGPRIDRATLTHDNGRTLLTPAAHDYASRAATLRYQVRLGDGAWSRPRPGATIDLTGLDTRDVRVRAVDPAGNVGPEKRVRAIAATRPAQRATTTGARLLHR